MPDDLALVPRPRSCRRQPGHCAASLTRLRIHPAAATLPAVRAHAQAMGLRLIADRSLAMHGAVIGESAMPTPPAQEDGYALSITHSGVALRGHDARGLVWGLTTLAQMMAQSARPACVTISDWPTYRIRYHHDDISRHQVSTRDDFLRIIRHLGSLKVSHYTLYIEDMVTVDGIPLMGEGRGALTPDDVRALVAEGERWQVEVFPTLSLAGHQENLLRLPRYRGLGARTWQPPSTFDPNNPAVRKHLTRILDAVCPLFPSSLFHMGFDEVLGLDAAGFTAHLNWCAKQLVQRGKTPLFWADMLYNHFGCKQVRALHPAAVPVVWGYSADEATKGTALKELLRHRDRVWILAGYNTWCNFFHPPMAEMHAQWSAWRKVANPRRIEAFGVSQWGDVGYENHRDIAWPLIAAAAEHGWSGTASESATVEARFQTIFHGHPLPELTKLRALLASDLAISGRQAWNLHRLPAPGWQREAAAGRLPSAAQITVDARKLRAGERLLTRCRATAIRERDHLRHYQVAIDRLSSVNRRAAAARDHRQLSTVLPALARAQRSYRSAWLAYNRSEGLEISLAVYAEQKTSWRTLGQRPQRVARGFHPLDLGRQWNSHQQGATGAPIGSAVIADVPFRFAPIAQTHAEIAPGSSLTLTLPTVPLRDLHVVASQPRDGEMPRPSARLRLSLRGHVVYEEDLLGIRHLCDWWAPLGDHMWAGGGFAYVDPLRVRWLLSPGPYYGLTCIQRFPWPAAPTADRLELTCLGTKPLQIFAITAEEALR